MSERITLADVARESQVSQSTVSLVLRDKPGIPPETRERVLAVAQALGYRARPRPATPAARSKAEAAGALRSVGVVIKTEPGIPPLANPFYSHVIAGIADACLQMRLNLLYAHLPVDEHNLPVDLPPVLTENQVDGFILVGMYVSETLGRMLRAGGAPVVLVDAYAGTDEYDAVLSDNVGGAYQAVTYLIRRGHRHIGIVGGAPGAYPSLRERREGYLKALHEAGIDHTYLADTIGFDAAAASIRSLLAGCPEVTAVFACNDHLAIQVLQQAEASGRRVPDDLSVIGFDDIDTAQYLTPALSTMHVGKTAMGRMAVQLLRDRLDAPSSDHVTVTLRPRLVERDSVKSLG